MNYAWEVYLQAQERDTDTDSLWFSQIKSADPYREVPTTDINIDHLDSQEIPVNSFYRYSEIFEELLDHRMSQYPELVDALFNIVMHHLIQIDLQEGLSKHEFQTMFLMADLQQNVFGEKLGEIKKFFPTKQYYQIVASILAQYKTGCSLLGFKKIFRSIFPKSIIYLDSEYGKELLVYVGVKQNATVTYQVNCLCDFFVPFDYQVELFWINHFGLIGTDETMMINEIMQF